MVSEFEFIENIKSRYSLARVGDDCAVLPKNGETDLLLTADMLVEDIDFRLEWTTPEFLGHKALAISLSDIAAMRGDPVWAMLSVGIPEQIWNNGFIDRFYAGLMSLAGEFDVEIVGGDISKTPDKIVIDSMVGGEVAKGKAVLRSGAKAGDAIFVTGTLGGAAGGLKLLENGGRLDELSSKAARNLLLRQLQPQPQLNILKELITQDIATAQIDISDGLSSDLNHLCTASGVGAQIDAKSLPVDISLIDFFTNEECIQMALNGGEDFELLFTADEKKISETQIEEITRIGTVTANIGIIELMLDGSTVVLEPKGYRHF